MRIKTIKLKLYKFDELSEEAKERAIGDNRYIYVEDVNWYEWTEGEFKDVMSKKGYEVKNVYFSGFYSQGDGACFVGSVYVKDWLKAHKLCTKYRRLYNYAKDNDSFIEIEHIGHYYHSNSMSLRDYMIDLSYYNEDKTLVSQADEVYELIKAEVKEMADKLYKDLEEEYDNLTDDETIKEYLREESYDFTEDGEINY